MAKAGIGSAMNDTTRQVGGALGVAVIGSVLASVYRPHVTANLATHRARQGRRGSGPLAGQAQTAVNAIRDQLGAVYAVADKMPGGAGGPAGQELIHAARHAFVDGFGGAVLVGALVALVGAVVVFIFLPAHASDAPRTTRTCASPRSPTVAADEPTDRRRGGNRRRTGPAVDESAPRAVDPRGGHRRRRHRHWSARDPADAEAVP